MLARNPNGPTRWQGAGSARAAPRNRFHSPGFGSGRPAPPPIKIIPPKTTETKRRRVGEDASSSRARPAETQVPHNQTTNGTSGESAVNGRRLAPVVNGAFPISNAPPGVNGTPMKEKEKEPSGLGSPTRLRMPSAKPSTPVVSSPLRQGWTAESPPSPAARPTRAANLMTELIKEATPPKKKPEIVNPYEQVAPVKPPARKQRKVRATQKEKEKEKEREREKRREEKAMDELSTQEIIEATVPKGSKRARAPPGLSKVSSGAAAQAQAEAQEQAAGLRRSARLKSPEPAPAPVTMPLPMANGTKSPERKRPAVTVEDVSDEDESPSSKKQRKAPVPAPVPVRTNGDVEVVELDEGDVAQDAPSLRPTEVSEPSDRVPPLPQKQRQTSPLAGKIGARSFAPKEASKLRFSYQAEAEEREKEKEKQAEEQKEKDMKAEAKKADEKPAANGFANLFARPAGSSTSTFTPASSAVPAPAPGRSIPSFFASSSSTSTTAAPPIPSSFASTASSNSTSAPAAPSAPPSFASLAPSSSTSTFTVPAAPPSFAAPAPAPGPSFSTAASPAPSPSPQDPRTPARAAPIVSLPVYRFDLDESAAVALKDYERAARLRAAGLGVASLPRFNWDPKYSAPKDEKDKGKGAAPMLVAKEMKDTEALVESKPPATFNWAAAGMKMQSAPKDEWTCGICGCKTPMTKAECVACETPR
jgi:hypothetical protein